MKEEHILLSADGPDCNVLKLKPPMVFTKANVDEFISTLDRILKELRERELDVPSEKEMGTTRVISRKQMRETRTTTTHNANIVKEDKIKSI